MQISEYSQPVKPFEYQPPVPMQLMMSVMDSKSHVMSDNLNKLQTHVDQMGQLDVARDIDKIKLNSKLSELVGHVNSMGGQDLSDPNVYARANSLGSSISGDKQIINALAQTRMMRSEMQAADDARKKGKGWAQQNENYLNRQVQQYLGSTDEQAKFSGKWTSYYDYNKDLQDAYSQMKANGTYRQKLDGTFGLFSENGEEISPERIHDYLGQRMNNDPRIRQQMVIDADDSYGNAPVKNIMNGYLPLARQRMAGYDNRISGINADMASLKNSADFITNKDKQQQYQDLQGTKNQYTQEAGGLSKKLSDPAALAADITANKTGYGMEILQHDLGRQYTDQFAYSKAELKHLAAIPKTKADGTQSTSPLGDAVAWDPAGDNDKKVETETSLQNTIDTYGKKVNDIKQQLYNDIHQEYGNSIRSPAQIDDFIKQQEQLITSKQFDKVSPEYKQVRNQLVQAKLEKDNAQHIISDVNNRVTAAYKNTPQYQAYTTASSDYAGQLNTTTSALSQMGVHASANELHDFLSFYEHGQRFGDTGFGAHMRSNGLDWFTDDVLHNLRTPNPVVKYLQTLPDKNAQRTALKGFLGIGSGHYDGHENSPLLNSMSDYENNYASIGSAMQGDKQKIYDADYSYAGQVPYRSFDYITADKQGGDKGALASMRNLVAQYADPSDLKKAKDADIVPRWVGNDEAGNVFIKYSVGEDQQLHKVKISPENASIFQDYLGADRYPAITHALLTKGETISNKAGEDIAANALSVFVPVHDPNTKKFLYDKPVYVRLYNTAISSGKLGARSGLNVRVQYIDPSSGITDWVGMKDERGNAPSFGSVEQALGATQMLFSNLANAGVSAQPLNIVPSLNH